MIITNKINLINTFLTLLPPSQAVPPSFPRTAPTWVTLMGCHPSSTAFSKMGPSYGHKSYQKICSSVVSSLHRSSRFCQEPAPAQASHRFKAFFQAPTCSGMGLLQGLQVNLCIIFAVHVLQGHNCLTMIFIMVCTRTSTPALGAPLPLPSLLTLVSKPKPNSVPAKAIILRQI